MKHETYNQTQALHAWVDDTLNNVKDVDGVVPLTQFDVSRLRATGHAMADKSYLRGDISEQWKLMVPRISTAMMDLYL